MSKIMSKLKGKERKQTGNYLGPSTRDEHDINDNGGYRERQYQNNNIRGPRATCRWLSDVVAEATVLCQQLNDIHWKMELELEAQVTELLQLKREAAASLSAADRCEFQTNAVRIAAEHAKEAIRRARIKEDKASAELADTCWKPQRVKWVKLRNNRSQTDLRKFLEEITEKRKGLKLLGELVEARLEKLTAQVTKANNEPRNGDTRHTQVAQNKSNRKIIHVHLEGFSEDGDDEDSSDGMETGGNVPLFLRRLYGATN